MGDFRYDANGNVRYEPGRDDTANLAEAAANFNGDWDADLAALDSQPTSMGQLQQALAPSPTDEAIATGRYLLGHGVQAEHEHTLGEAFRAGIVRGREAVLGPDLSDGGEPPHDEDDDTEEWDGDDEGDDGKLEVVLGTVIILLAGATLWRIAAGVWGWIS